MRGEKLETQILPISAGQFCIFLYRCSYTLQDAESMTTSFVFNLTIKLIVDVGAVASAAYSSSRS